MTAFTWTAEDGSTGRLTGRAAEIVEVLAVGADQWATRQGVDHEHLQAIVHGASLGTEDEAAKSELRALWEAMTTGPVTLKREGEG
jgi:hypothetical protein